MGTLAEGFRRRAGNKLHEAQQYLDRAAYAESISASQECIELSAKALFLLAQAEYPKRHELTDEDFERLLAKLPPEARDHNVGNLILGYQMVGSFHTIAKYGNERFNIGADQMFGLEEADLALHHARRWNIALLSLEGHFPQPAPS